MSVLLLSACVQALDTPESDDEHGVDFLGGVERLTPPDDEGWQHTPPLTRAQGFSRVGLRFDERSATHIEGRFRALGEEGFSAWLPMRLVFKEEQAHNGVIDVPFVAEEAQVRFLAPVEAGLQFVAIELLDRIAGSATSEGIALPPGQRDQGLAADGLVVTRAQWGARIRSCSGAHSPSRITVHHTVTPNDDSLSMAARIRQIQAYHIDVRGWCDIGYHFLVGQDGLVYEGRPENRLGAHAAGANANNVGISFVGDFEGRSPADAQLNAAARILRALSETYSIPRTRSTVKGHRQIGTTSTACPGATLYGRLEELLARADDVDAVALPVASDDGSPPTGAPGCYSNSAGRTVDHGTCVQVDYAGCGQGSCAWYTCDGGEWQCSHLDSCPGATSLPNPACGAVTPPSFAPCFSATLGRHIDHGACVQVAYPGCGLDECALYRCHDSGWQCGDAATCTDEQTFENAACAAPPGSADTATSGSYGDLPPSHPAFAAAEALRRRGAMWGCAPGEFCPEQAASRAELAYLLHKLTEGPPQGPISPLFDDVHTSDWFFEAVQDIATRGITSGCGTRTFCPDAGVSRSALAVFLTRAQALPPIAPAIPTFLDVPMDHWAIGRIEAAAAASLMTGCDDALPHFCPADLLSRGELAVIVAAAYLGPL
ncbi:MAG: N-acetylmuramoyl-L-alanine amidase [Myxococcota bacterium]